MPNAQYRPFKSKYESFNRAPYVYVCADRNCNERHEVPRLISARTEGQDKPTVCRSCGKMTFNKCDSGSEADRYAQLVLLEKFNVIKDLEVQVKFPLEWQGLLIATYVADFVYTECKDNKKIVEDWKGSKDAETNEFKRKVKLMKQIYGIEIFRNYQSSSKPRKPKRRK